MLERTQRKRNPAAPFVGNANYYRHYEEHFEVSLETKMELTYDPAIPLLGIYPEKTLIQKVTCTPVFIAVLFTIAKT